tara:strand:+ start:115 stop:327 length:213 start_codon:yes stop_codon:yes gene_type:complete
MASAHAREPPLERMEAYNPIKRYENNKIENNPRKRITEVWGSNWKEGEVRKITTNADMPKTKDENKNNRM